MDNRMAAFDHLASASVTITNTGSRPGTETVQLYIADPVARAVRPYKELRGFQRITLQPGESQTVSFTIDANTLSYYAPGASSRSNGRSGFRLEGKKFTNLQTLNLQTAPDYVWSLEPGDFEIHIGPNAAQTNMALLTVQ